MSGSEKWMELNIQQVSVVGLWPAGFSSVARALIVLALHLIQIIGAFVELIWHRHNLKDTCDIISGFLAPLVGAYILVLFVLKNRQAVVLVDKIRHRFVVTDISRDTERANICMVKTYTVMNIIVIGSFLLFPLLNYSLTGELALFYKIRLPYKLDNKRNISLTIVLQSVTNMLLGTVVISVACFFASLIQHLCGQLMILQRSLEHLNELDFQQLRIELNRCIRHHQMIIGYTNDVQKLYGAIFTSHNLLMTINMSVILFKVSLITFDENFAMLTALVAQVVCASCEILLICCYAQKLTDHSLRVADMAYATEWYNFPMDIRKDIIFIIKRSQRPLVLTAFSYTIGLGMSTAVFSTTYSYFTLLLNINK